MGRIPGPISICPNSSSDRGYALALTNLFRQSFSQGELKRREKLKLSLKGFQGPSVPAKAQLAFEAYATNLINLSRQSFGQGEFKGGGN